MTRDEQRAWLGQVTEDILDADRPIVDPHHHLWKASGGGALPPYLLDDLWEDTESGHNIVQTVFLECGAEYRADGPDHLKPVGETEFVASVASDSRGQGRAEIAAIVGHVRLTLDATQVREALTAHEEAGQGLFRGIRHGGAHDPFGDGGFLNATNDPYLFANPVFRSNVALLGELGYSFDTWQYHLQNPGYLALAKAVPGTQMILDHFASPIRKGRYADGDTASFAQWKDEMAQIAECPNVVAKLGGLAMSCNGFGWHERATPATSDEVAEAHRPWYLHMIEVFGAERCMFESNFPVDKMSMSYHVYWNAMKKIAADFSEAEQDALFRGTASRIYRLPAAG